MATKKQKFNVNLQKKFKTDDNLEVNGIIIKMDEELTFTIARAGGANKAFNRKTRKATQPYRRQIASGAVDDELMAGIMKKVFCQTCLKAWTGVTDENGKAVPCNVENALALFTELPELYDQLQEDATNAQLFLADIKEAEAGN